MNEPVLYFVLFKHAQFAREVGQFYPYRSVHMILSQNISVLDVMAHPKFLDDHPT
jgi:hypothetical protein